jgi:hypothetical protein
MLFSQSILRAEWKAKLCEGIAINANKPSSAQSKTGHPTDLSLLGHPNGLARSGAVHHPASKPSGYSTV